MFYTLSKFLPLFVYPVGFATLGIMIALILGRNEQHRKWQTITLWLALAALWLGGNRLVSMALGKSLEWRYLPLEQTPKVDAIVVLGGATEAQTWPRTDHEVGHAGDRMLYAARLYHAGAAPVVIVTGGSSPLADPDTVPEAVAMADILMLAGIPEEAIILEPEAINTYDNALKVNAILEEKGYTSIALVTSALHMPRSMGIFKTYHNLEVIAAPTDFRVTELDWDYYRKLKLDVQLMNLIPRAKYMERTTAALKEYIGLVVYRLRGWSE